MGCRRIFRACVEEISCLVVMCCSAVLNSLSSLLLLLSKAKYEFIAGL